MAIPHYTYLVLKMPGPNGVISVNGDIKQAYDCDKESCEMTDALLASIEPKESHGQVPARPGDARIKDFQAIHPPGG
jgi:hypothetical protein